jgi:hypothetical protein
MSQSWGFKWATEEVCMMLISRVSVFNFVILKFWLQKVVFTIEKVISKLFQFFCKWQFVPKKKLPMSLEESTSLLIHFACYFYYLLSLMADCTHCFWWWRWGSTFWEMSWTPEGCNIVTATHHWVNLLQSFVKISLHIVDMLHPWALWVSLSSFTVSLLHNNSGLPDAHKSVLLLWNFSFSWYEFSLLYHALLEQSSTLSTLT